VTQFRFLYDENVEPRLRAAARQRLRDVVVWAVGDPGAPPFGALDPEILEWCEGHGFILVTNNRASMPVHLSKHLAAGRHVPGIFILNPGMSAGDVAAELDLICGASAPDEYRDAIHHLPVSR
jgi:hypothetical protein